MYKYSSFVFYFKINFSIKMIGIKLQRFLSYLFIYSLSLLLLEILINKKK